MEPAPRKTDHDQNHTPEESKDLKQELKEKRELQIAKLGSEYPRPFTPPPPYDPMGEVLDGVLYDIEINPADGNYYDIDEYRQEVDGFLRLLFRIDDSTNRAYSPLKYDSHITIPDDGGETVVRIKFVLSSYGNQNSITFHSAAEDFCSRVFHQRSGPIVKHLTALERLGLSPLSPIFRQYWTMALYHSCAQLGPNFFLTFPGAKAERGRWPRWAVTVHFFFLGLGRTVGFDGILRAMAGRGVEPLSSWAQSDPNQLEMASNTAKSYFRRYISDMISPPVGRQNQQFQIKTRHYQAQIHSVFEELERLSSYDFMARDTVTICNELYGAIESSCIMFTANREMCDLLFGAQITGGVGEAGAAVGVGLGAREIYTSVKVTRALAGRAMFVGVTSWPTLALGALMLGCSAVGYFNSRGDRVRATAAQETHKAVNIWVMSSLNISYDILKAIRILQHREQILEDLETGTRPFTENQAWWISTVNAGQETGFDMARVRSYLLIQRGHLMSNYEKIEGLVPRPGYLPVTA